MNNYSFPVYKYERTYLNIMNETKKKKLWGSLFVFLIGLNALGGLEMVYILKNDARILTRNAVKNILQDTNEPNILVGILGSNFGYQYREDREKHILHKIETVRDWSNSSFGFIIKGQVSLVQDPFAIQILYPDILINIKRTSALIDSEQINKMGYNLEKEIKSMKPYFNRFEIITSSNKDFLVYVKDGKQIKYLKNNLSLEKQLLIIHSLRNRFIHSQKNTIQINEIVLRRIGENVQDFYNPDLSNKTIDKLDIMILAHGYKLAGRKVQADKAFAFIDKI